MLQRKGSVDPCGPHGVRIPDQGCHCPPALVFSNLQGCYRCLSGSSLAFECPGEKCSPQLCGLQPSSPSSGESHTGMFFKSSCTLL